MPTDLALPSVCDLKLNLFTGTAGVPPASSNKFTHGTVESSIPDDLAFNESGRDARGPSEEVELGAQLRGDDKEPKDPLS